MHDIQLYRVKGQHGFASVTFESSENLIFEMANKGYEYKGYIPIKMEGYGIMTEYDLVFEKVE